MSPESPPECLFVFDSTHQALWAEDVARERAIPAEVVPAPAGARAKCSLALRSAGDHCEPLATALTNEGVEFRPYPE